MNTEIENLIEGGSLSEPEIFDFIYVYKKFVDCELFSKNDFEKYLIKLGIEWDGGNSFKISDTVEYILN